MPAHRLFVYLPPPPRGRRCYRGYCFSRRDNNRCNHGLITFKTGIKFFLSRLPWIRKYTHTHKNLLQGPFKNNSRLCIRFMLIGAICIISTYNVFGSLFLYWSFLLRISIWLLIGQYSIQGRAIADARKTTKQILK